MTVVASSGTASSPGSMLVAFPITQCSGRDSAVFLDDKGAFVSAVAPGTATYLTFPEGQRLFVVSNRDVLAPRGTAFKRHEIANPGSARVERGIVVEVPRRDAKTCSENAAPVPEVVTYEIATRAAINLKWLDVNTTEGPAWVDEHRPRVDEIVGGGASAPPREAGARSSAVYGNVEPDPLLVDPSTFEVDKPNEGDARRVAVERCGGPADLVQSRVVKGTTAGKCEKAVLAGVLQGHQTTNRASSGVVCTPAADDSERTVHRFRCMKR